MTVDLALPQTLSGLAEIADRYRVLLCDVWGVVHNGVARYADAVGALRAFRRGGRHVVLITNAPRPAWSVIRQLDEIGVDRDAYDAIVTSGDVTVTLLTRMGASRVHHLGPDRDLPLYQGLAVELSDIDSASVSVCTGLVDDEVETVADYEDRLQAMARRGLPMLCANPDLVVERGGKLVLCAGALAVRYREIGGAVTLIGKPYPAIYDAAMEQIAEVAGGAVPKAAVLAIGDGAATDIRGANQAGFDSLFIVAGIHAEELAAASAGPDFFARHGARPVAIMPHLSW
ncbi:MAG: TIGR01459 family HAD-type hydrolase [Bauldia sp.]|nr:TIGR01459 family HAD-type hydrolase [Bauldia sp.]